MTPQSLFPEEVRTGPSAEELEKRIRFILKHTGRRGVCKGCPAPVVWVMHDKGAWMPYTELGEPHWVDCPGRGQFRRTP